MISSKDNELKHDYYSFVERGVREISTGITALSNSLRLSLDEMDESSSPQLMYGRGRLHVRFSRSFFPILKRIWELSKNQDFRLYVGHVLSDEAFFGFKFPRTQLAKSRVAVLRSIASAPSAAAAGDSSSSSYIDE